jgi:hypothetical protein
MSNGFISIKLLESDIKIQKNMYKALADAINKSINKYKGEVTAQLKSSIGNWIRSQPEINSLLANGAFGSLSAQFGLPIGSANFAVGQIISEITNNVNINFTPVNDKLKGSIEFNFQPADYLNLLGLSNGHVLTEKGVDLHWLDWLLIQGDTVIILGYDYVPASRGRSGGGYMSLGKTWRVPPEFSGTPTNNFITRSFDGRDNEIINILKGLFK